MPPASDPSQLPAESTPIPAGADSAAPQAGCDLSASDGSCCPWVDALVLMAAFTVLTWGIGDYGLYEPHEGHFAGVGREMLCSGDWLTPQLNGSPYLNKPPLIYWAIGLSYRIFGINEFAARLPAALLGWMGVLVAWRWATRLWNRQAGRIAAGMLSVTAGWFLFTHQIMIDAALSALIFCSLYAFWRCVERPELRRNWLIFYLTLALALMAKGPIGAAPGVVGLAFMALSRRWSLLRQCGLFWGIPLVLLPVTIWALAVESCNPGFLRHIIVDEHLMRLKDERWPRDYAVSQIGALGYLGVTAIWCAPWILLAPQIWMWLWKKLRANSAALDNIEHTPPATRDGLLILALGAAWPVLFFLPIPSRLIYYSLPSLPPLVLLAAGWWSTQGQRRGAGLRPAGASLAVLGAVVFSSGFWAEPILAGIPDLQVAPGALAPMKPMAFLMGAGLFAGGVLLAAARPLLGIAVLCTLWATACTQAAAGFAGYQEVRSSQKLVAELDPLLGPDTIWISEGSYELGASAGIAFYLGQDSSGRARTVRVMTDDERRPQPQFGKLPRAYGMERQELQTVWNGTKPALFITDLMRRDFITPAQAPRLPQGSGPVYASFGFRRVYLNPAAWAKLTAPQ